MEVSERPRIAPAGAIWVCSACGKTSRDRYGDPNSSWDESCMTNAILCDDQQRFGDDALVAWAILAFGCWVAVYNVASVAVARLQ